MEKEKFSEVRCLHFDEDGTCSIDAYVTEDEYEEGICVATVNVNGIVSYNYPQKHFGSNKVIDAIFETKQEQQKRKQEIVDKCIEEIKKDVSIGDFTAIEELLKIVDANYLKGYLAED